tara:strand:+ start:227 stop:472 length:246 start_codon:yes stop_codon:yes gene_type:complete
MIKIALIVVVTSSFNLSQIPDISISNLYDDINSCNFALDNIKSNLKTDDMLDENKTRYLRMEIREAHQEGFIFWTCRKKNT